MSFLSFFLQIFFPPSRIEEQLHVTLREKTITPAMSPPFPWMTSVYSYRENIIRQSIRLLKNRRNTPLATLFAKEMYRNFSFQKNKYSLVIPIPISKKRKSERGFNQVTLIARAFTSLDKNFSYHENILIKIKETKKQALVHNRQERLGNVIGCFDVVDKKTISGQSIILIDDVTTTGATLSEARKTLLHYGACDVVAITFAH